MSFHCHSEEFDDPLVRPPLFEECSGLGVIPSSVKGTGVIFLEVDDGTGGSRTAGNEF